MKKTYKNQLPKNIEVSNTNVRVENGEIIVDVEFKEKFKPKFGDIIHINFEDCQSFKRDYMISIYPDVPYLTKGIDGILDIANINLLGEFSNSCGIIDMVDVVPASESEKQELFDKLKEQGLKWNPETKQLENIYWRAKKNETYYYITDLLTVDLCTELNGWADNKRYKTGNYFQTKREANKVLNKIKDVLRANQ